MPPSGPTGRPIAFTFDGTPIDALEGETIAAALSATGVTTFRHTPSGAPRGLHCGMGACWDCVVTVDGRIGQRACMTPAADGAWWCRAAFPRPWPNTLPRRQGANGSATSWSWAAALPACRQPLRLRRPGPPSCCWTNGTRRAVSIGKPLAPSHTDSAPDKQFALGASLRAAAEQAGAALENDALVWGAFAPDEIAALVRGQSVTYRPRRLILAPGAHEAPTPMPGWTLPGVMTTGGLQALVRSQRVLPGSKVLIAGNGPLNLQLACEMLAARREARRGAGGGAPRPASRRR